MVTTKDFWIVLAISVVVHWRLPPRMRGWFLAVVSFAYITYLGWFSSGAAAPPDVKLGAPALLVFAIAFYLTSQRLFGRPRALVVALIVAVLGYLAYYKYFPSIFHAIVKSETEPNPAALVVVPLGASYFTFKLIHYVLESSRRRRGPDGVDVPNIPPHRWDDFLSYVFFFPIFTAGPIERFDTPGAGAPATADQPRGWLKSRADRLTTEMAVGGITRIIYGLIKKFVIVDLWLSKTNLIFEKPRLIEALPLWNPPLRLEQLLQELHVLHPLFAWQFLINQFLTVYVDFSAYSDIAIGCSLLFGVRVMENFDWPIFAANISEFWKKWHISLSSWCQQYVYLPMIGRTRNPYIAVYATQVAIGVWHAGNLNYLSWGAYHATLMVIYLTWGRIKRKRKWRFSSPALTYASMLFTFLCVTAGHAFVSTSSIGLRPAVRLLAKLVGINILIPGMP